MQVYNHYLVAQLPQKPLRTKVKWNGPLLGEALQKALEDIASWKELCPQSQALFKGFAPSGGRSYVCVLTSPIETPMGPHSAVKLKAVGNTNPERPHPPLPKERFDLDPHRIIVEEDGSIAVKAGHDRPHYGSVLERVKTENSFLLKANGKGLPAPFSLGEIEYPELVFEGNPLGCNIMAVKNLETERRRLANFFQVDHPSPQKYLRGITITEGLRDLEYLFYTAGEVQRAFNDKGLIPGDCHAGNFSLTEDAKVILNDFGAGKSKDDLSVPQISVYQLLDLNRFIYSMFILRARPIGELLMSETHPVSAFLEGYFGRDLMKDIGTPEKMIRRLARPQAEPEKNRLMGSMQIMRYSWVNLYEPLQEILGAEGYAYPLTEGERIERHVGIFRGYFRGESKK